MATYNKFNVFVEHEAAKVHNLGADALKVALTDTAPGASDAGFLPGTAHPPPAAANGYTSGGHAVTVTTSSQTAGTYTLAGNQIVITATAGGIGPFRYVLLYNDTPTSPADAVIAWWDYGSSITLNDGETFTVKFNNANPGTIFTKV
jgi:hypothetical protein